MSTTAVVIGNTLHGIPSQLDIATEKNLFITGRTGCGKTKTIRNIAQQMVDQDVEVQVVSGRGSIDFGDVEGVGEIVEDRYNARQLLVEVTKEIADRNKMLVERQQSYEQLPEDIKPARLLLIIDDLADMIAPLAYDASEDEYSDVEEYNEAGAFIKQAAKRIVSNCASVGVHLLLSTQWADPTLKVLRSNCAHLMIGVLNMEEQERIKELSPGVNLDDFYPGGAILESLDGTVHVNLVLDSDHE